MPILQYLVDVKVNVIRGKNLGIVGCFLRALEGYPISHDLFSWQGDRWGSLHR